MLKIQGPVIRRLREAGRLPSVPQGAHNVKTSITEYQSLRQMVQESTRYTESGKKEMLAKIQGEVDASRSYALNALSAEWKNIRRDFQRIDERRRAAAERQAATWDYGRLAYEATVASEFIRSAAGNPVAGTSAISEIQKAYTEAMESGDRVKARAWAEVAPQIQARFMGADIGVQTAAGQLARTMSVALAQLTASDEEQALVEESAALLQRVMDLQRVTAEADDFYNPDKSPFSSTPSEWESLQIGVNLQQKIDPTIGDFVSYLDITG